MLAHPADGGRERLREDEVAEHLDGVRLELVDVGARRSGGRSGGGSRCGRAGRAASSAGASAASGARSGAGPRGGSRRVASHEYDATTFDAMSVFSRSKAAKWRAGSSTWRRSRSSRFSPVRPPGVGAHAGVLDDRRQVDLGGVVVPVDDPGVEAERGLVLGVEARPSARAGGRRRRSPRTRRRRRRARRRRGPARPPRASPRGWPPTRPACRGAAATAATRSPRSMAPLARSSWRCTRPRPGNDHSGTMIGWPSAS